MIHLTQGEVLQEFNTTPKFIEVCMEMIKDLQNSLYSYSILCQVI